MSENIFFMLGIIHRDKDGPDLLKSWLNRIRSDVITLELSHYGVRFRRELGEAYKERIGWIAARHEERGEPYNKEALSSLLSYVAIPYEFNIVSQYATKCGIPFHLIDMDFFSYVKLRAIEDLVSEKNIEAMLSGMEDANGNQELAMARLYFEKGLKVAQYDREMHVRDRYMSTKIKDLMKQGNGKKILHVCGWRHLQDPSNLYGPLNPIKVFSHDKTVCL